MKKWRCRRDFWQYSSTGPKGSSRTLLPPGMSVVEGISVMAIGTTRDRSRYLEVLSE